MSVLGSVCSGADSHGAKVRAARGESRCKLEAFKAGYLTGKNALMLDSGRLNSHSHYDLAEVLYLEHSDERFGRFFKTVNDVLAIADAAFGNSGPHIAQEFGVELSGKFVEDEAAQGQALRQDLAHRGGQPIGTLGRSCLGVMRYEATHRHARRIF